jgi:2,4-dienoyl-CoA reductase-like NADH-dependent reductase (Old Yellow Enzyme family)
MVMKLFEPITVGKFTFKNRLVFAPYETNFATQEGMMTQRHIDHYKKIARGGVGLIVVEGTVVNPNLALRFSPLVMCLNDDKMIPNFQKLAQTIHEEGCKTIVQLEDKSLVATARRPVDLELTEIQALIDYFVKAAVRVQKTGFEGVDFHLAHLYTLADFLSMKANKRTDEYGKGIEGRTKIAVEILQRTRDYVGKDFLIVPRFSGDEFVIGGNTLKQTKVIAKILEEAGADILDISAGGRRDEVHDIPEVSYKMGENSYSAHRSVPFDYMPDGANIYLPEAIKKVVKIPVIAVGKIKTAELAEEILQEGKADLIAMGRQIFCDPDTPRKIKEGREKEVITCLSCRHCTRTIFQSKPIECSQWKKEINQANAPV